MDKNSFKSHTPLREILSHVEGYFSHNPRFKCRIYEHHEFGYVLEMKMTTSTQWLLVLEDFRQGGIKIQGWKDNHSKTWEQGHFPFEPADGKTPHRHIIDVIEAQTADKI